MLKYPILFLTLILLFIGCTEQPLEPDLLAAMANETNVIISPEILQLGGVGTSTSLLANVTPNELSDSIVWASSDNTIVVVNSDGMVTAISTGTVTITAKVTAGSIEYTGIGEVNVPLLPITGIWTNGNLTTIIQNNYFTQSNSSYKECEIVYYNTYTKEFILKFIVYNDGVNDLIPLMGDNIYLKSTWVHTEPTLYQIAINTVTNSIENALVVTGEIVTNIYTRKD